MADNVQASIGSEDGAVFATDDIAGIHYPVSKIGFGALGALTLISTANGLPVELVAGTAAIGKLAANSGVDIGDVDVISLPAGNLGQRAMAASLSIVPANNITDATYIGDIKFGEALPAGANAIGKLAANSGVDIGDVDVTSIAAATSGGCSFFKSIDLDQTEEEVKGTAGQLYGGVVMNMRATPLYFKIYNATAETVTVGTTVPDLTFAIPSAGDTSGAGFVIPIPAQGVAFGTAITVACTTGVADNDSGAPGANECIVALFFK